MKLSLTDMDVLEHELRLTEAFRKGYSSKMLPLRRLSYPFKCLPGLKELVIFYKSQNI